MSETNELDGLDELDGPIPEVQELTWALVDEYATEEQVRRLETLLLEDDEARRTYVMCMQLHADLHFLYNPRPALPAVLQKMIDAEKAKESKRALPIVDLSNGSGASYTSGCV